MTNPEEIPRAGISPARYRQLRGLLLHFRRAWPEIRRRRKFRRGLINTFPYHQGEGGVCRWCQLPTAQGAPRQRWDRDCITAYRAAVGGRLDTNGQPLVPHSDCPCGRPGQEVDHRDALVLAWTSGEPSRLLRAYSLDNLMWLCHDCHRAKTRLDLQQLAEMRAQQVCLAGDIPASRQQQPRYWVLVEGSVTPQRGLGLRRIPTTFSPQLVTCPRCINAMAEPQARPGEWALDEEGMDLN